MYAASPSTELIPLETLEEIAPVLRHIAHPVRLRILDFLRESGEPCTVSEIVAASGAPQAIVSQHLRILKDLRVVLARRNGTFMHYSIRIPHVAVILDCVRHHA